MDNKLMIGIGVAGAALGVALIASRSAAVRNAVNTMTGNYFTISELSHSDYAKSHGIDNTPPAEAQRNMRDLINYTLNPIREAYGKPIRVSSGYRCPVLNKAVGGVGNSQHLLGLAADLQPLSGGSLADIFRAAVRCNSFDQLIIERVGNARWIHVSHSGSPRRQMYAYSGGVYTPINANNFEAYIV